MFITKYFGKTDGFAGSIGPGNGNKLVCSDVSNCEFVHGAGGTLLQHWKEHALHTDLRPNDVLFYFTTCGWMMWNWLVSVLASGATAVLFDGNPAHPSASILFDIAERERLTLLAVVRQGDTVARIGGDEFVVVLENLHTHVRKAARQAEGLAEKMRQSLAQPMPLAGQSVQTSCSIGVVMFADASASADDLMKHADLAMYQAKEAGRNVVRFFDPEMHAAVVYRMHLEQDLRTALQEGQLILFYQVQVNAQAQPIGFEALVRWRHPRHGLVSPGEFIPLAGGACRGAFGQAGRPQDRGRSRGEAL